MKQITQWVAAILLSCLSLTSYANLIKVDLRSFIIEELDGKSSFDYVLDGLVTSVQSNVGVLNRTASGFGVDIVGSGCDNSDAIDRSCAGSSGEMISVWFDQPVELVSIHLSGLTGGDMAKWILPDSTTRFIDLAGEYFVGHSMRVEPGVSFSLMSAADNTTATQRGFSFDGFTVKTAELQSIAVNGPSTLFCMLAPLIIGLLFHRLKLKRGMSSSDDLVWIKRFI